MKSVIHRNLKQAERRESHLWILACGLLILFGTALAGHFAAASFDGSTENTLTRVTAYRELVGLLFLVVLFVKPSGLFGAKQDW